MLKIFDCEEEPNECMDMPCMCDCGKWFDLNDVHNSRKSNKIICAECKENEDDFHRGDEVTFTEACYINGRLRAYEYDKGVVISLSETDGCVSVKINNKRYPIHNVPTGILEKI